MAKAINLPVLGEAEVADRFLTSLPNKEHGIGSQPLPMTMQEALSRGWKELDVVIVTGDAYIDHPSFAMSILGRVLEAAGFRVGIISQPNWRSCNDWKRFGRPRLFFGDQSLHCQSESTQR